MTPIDKRAVRLAALPVAALFALAACGGSSTPAPSAAGSQPAATQVPASQAVATEAPATETPATEAPASEDTGVTLPSGLFNQAPDLEAQLPSQACGGPVIKQSWAGSASGDAASANPMIGAFGALGAGGGDVAIAMAASTTPDTCPVSFFAYRVKGLNSSMFATVLAAMAAGGSQQSLGGKTVTKIPSGDTSTYIYVKDDTMFGVDSASDDQAGQALSAMP